MNFINYSLAVLKYENLLYSNYFTIVWQNFILCFLVVWRIEAFDAICRHIPGSAFDQVMACCLTYGTKISPEPMLLALSIKTSQIYFSEKWFNLQTYHSKIHLKHILQNVDHVRRPLYFKLYFVTLVNITVCILYQWVTRWTLCLK